MGASTRILFSLMGWETARPTDRKRWSRVSVRCWYRRSSGERLRLERGLVSGNGVEESSGERSVDAVEEFQEDQADRISLGRQTVAAGAGQLFDRAFRAQLGEVVSKGGPSCTAPQCN